MTKLRAVLLCLTLVYACNNGGRVVAAWENGKPKTIVYQGYQDNFIEEYDARGIKREEGFEVDNLRQGKWTAYDSLGNKESETIYDRGLRFGLHTAFYPNGQKKEEGYYTDGNKDDLWQAWDETGKLLSEANFEDGTQVDPVIAYDQMRFAEEDKGNMIASLDTLLGKDTLLAEIQPEGSSEDVPPVPDIEVRDGPWESRYPNGKVSEKGTYHNGQKIGTWRYYYDNGTKISKGRYWEGDVKKIVIDPEIVEVLKQEGQQTFRSLKIGVWQYWNKAGKPEKSVKYSIQDNRYFRKEL